MTVTPSDGEGAPWSPPPDPAYETAQVEQIAAPTLEPVRPPRRSRMLWATAGLGTLALAILLGGLAFANLRPGGTSVLPRYAAAASTFYVEARLDLPGDQREQLLALLAHFPGLEDEAAFDAKVEELFDKLASEADEGVRWDTDIQPWFGGQVAAFGSIDFTPEQAAFGEAPDAEAVVAVSVRDRAAALDFVSGRAANHEWAAEDYGGATVWTGRLERGPIALALTDDALLAGESVELVKAAIDVSADPASGLGQVAAYSQAVAKLHADRLATVYIDGDALAGLADGPQGPMGMGLSSTTTFDVMVAEVRAEGDHMAVTARVRPATGGPPLPSNKSTTLAQRVPADSLFYLEVRQAGEGLRYAIEMYLEQLSEIDPEGGSFTPQLETLLGTQPEEFLEFLDDTAIAVSRQGESFSGGLVATLTDEQTARERMQRLVGVLRTGIAFETVPVTITEEEYAGATLTVLTPRLDAGPGGMPGMDFDIPAFSFTVDDGLLILGVDGFVRSVLDADGSSGLASTDRYRAALDDGGTDNAGVAYVDLAAARTLFEEMMAGEPDSEYESEMKPYLAPFDRLAIVTVRDGDELVSRVLVYVE